MIPHRRLSSEICGNGLRGRVTACRKRVRVSRVTQKARINNNVEELFAETPRVSGGLEKAARRVPAVSRPIPAAVVLMNQRYAGPENGESARLLSADEPEVGIT